MLKRLSPLLYALLLLSSCSGEKKAKAQVVVSLGAIVGATFSGGVLLKAVDPKTGNSKLLELSAPYVAILPFGTWSLYLVGYEGAVQWSGPHQCGGVEKYNFALDNQRVQITVNANNCNIEPYASLKALRSPSGAKWDESLWDMKNWE